MGLRPPSAPLVGGGRLRLMLAAVAALALVVVGLGEGQAPLQAREGTWPLTVEYTITGLATDALDGPLQRRNFEFAGESWSSWTNREMVADTEAPGLCQQQGEDGTVSQSVEGGCSDLESIDKLQPGQESLPNPFLRAARFATVHEEGTAASAQADAVARRLGVAASDVAAATVATVYSCAVSDQACGGQATMEGSITVVSHAPSGLVLDYWESAGGFTVTRLTVDRIDFISR